MAILVDISQIIIANMAVMQFSNRDKAEVDSLLITHMIINSLRLYNKRFKHEYGEMIICCDHRKTWRKEIFPLYKARRQVAKADGDIDWNVLYETMNKTLNDLKYNFPYKVLKVEGCEADDIIGVLAMDLYGQKNVIVSGDGDLTQLLRYKDVKQFHPITKKFIECANPLEYLKEKIIRGDDGDGVPNILSDDDVFMQPGGRQKPIYAKKVAQWLSQPPKQFCESDKALKNYERNKTLIDLTCTPQHLHDQIMAEYNIPAIGSKALVKEYFMANRMRNLLDVIDEF